MSILSPDHSAEVCMTFILIEIYAFEVKSEKKASTPPTLKPNHIPPMICAQTSDPWALNHKRCNAVNLFYNSLTFHTSDLSLRFKLSRVMR